MWKVLECVCLIALVSSSYGLTTLDLTGEWTVSNINRDISVQGLVPGSMYTALMMSGQMGDPYYRDNDEVYKWVGEEDWTFNKTFTASAELLAYPAVMLVCEGLDTVASVIVNNQTVGTSDNMFVRYIYDVKPALVEGENTIMIEFRSATQYVEEVANSLSYSILPTCVAPEYHGACGANLIRKMQCSFSWDWGPSFPAQGIWQPIYIQGYNTAVIRDVTAETTKAKDGTWQLTVDVFTEVLGGAAVQGQLEVKLASTNISSSKTVNLTEADSKVNFDIAIPESAGVEPWWPNGYGNQTLYDLFVLYTDATGTLNTKKIRIGFRTVELVQDYVSKDKTLGRTFYYRINGQAVYLKGSNWIPADILLERVTRDRVYNYLKSAADAHMNSMRVWGGGIYEFDMFYEIADELGIMIWQDFMFACSMYPTSDEFLASVKQEVTYQVRRMKHHPSIIVLSGNNENEKALVQDWYGTGANFSLYKDDYLTLYKDTIHTIVMQEDTSRPFIASSPSNGVQSEAEGWVAKEPWSTLYGDIHEYRYLVPFFEPGSWRVPRLSSEYGLQSYPSMESLIPVYNASDLDYWSDLNDYRNHHPFGNVEMMAEAIQYVKLPNCPDRKQRFSDIAYITQIDQAIGMRTMTEHYRRWQNELDDQGQGNTMGALYWMLADIWQAPTWASLEFEGKWKMIHYLASRFFEPTLISPFFDSENVVVYIVLDELPINEERHPTEYTLKFTPQSNPRPFSVFDLSTWGSEPADPVDEFSGNLYVEMYSWDNMTPLKIWKVPFQVSSTAEAVFTQGIDALAREAGCIRRQTCVLNFHFGNPDNGPSNWLPLSVFSNAQGLQKANITVTDVMATATPDQYTVTITTDNIAPFVWLEAYGIKGRFSDNGFLMFKPTMTLTFYSWQPTTVNDLAAALTVMSLQDVYY